MTTCGKWVLRATFVAATALAASSSAADVMRAKTVGPYRVELHVLPAEPFFSKDQVAANKVDEGMEIEGGAAPVMLDAPSHPNHHLVVHVFDRKSCQAVTDATVTMSFASVRRTRGPAGERIEVPIVIMQAIGKGPSSTRLATAQSAVALHCLHVSGSRDLAEFGKTLLRRQYADITWRRH
jgi:hypothetical protein